MSPSTTSISGLPLEPALNDMWSNGTRISGSVPKQRQREVAQLGRHRDLRVTRCADPAVDREHEMVGLRRVEGEDREVLGPVLQPGLPVEAEGQLLRLDQVADLLEHREQPGRVTSERPDRVGVPTQRVADQRRQQVCGVVDRGQGGRGRRGHRVGPYEQVRVPVRPAGHQRLGRVDQVVDQVGGELGLGQRVRCLGAQRGALVLCPLHQLLGLANSVLDGASQTLDVPHELRGATEGVADDVGDDPGVLEQVDQVDQPEQLGERPSEELLGVQLPRHGARDVAHRTGVDRQRPDRQVRGEEAAGLVAAAPAAPEREGRRLGGRVGSPGLTAGAFDHLGPDVAGAAEPAADVRVAVADREGAGRGEPLHCGQHDLRRRQGRVAATQPRGAAQVDPLRSRAGRPAGPWSWARRRCSGRTRRPPVGCLRGRSRRPPGPWWGRCRPRSPTAAACAACRAGRPCHRSRGSTRSRCRRPAARTGSRCPR